MFEALYSGDTLQTDINREYYVAEAISCLDLYYEGIGKPMYNTIN